MRRRAAAALLAVTATLAGCGRAPADKAAIEGIVHDYILAHPEIVPQAMEALQQKRAGSAIAANRAAIERPFAGAWTGSATPRVTLVMFSDYSCTFCKASAPDIARLAASEPDLRIVWREIPVLGPPSDVAARLALTAAKQGRYVAFHQGLFAAGRPDDATLASVATKAGLDPVRLAAGAKAPDIAQEIEGNLRLAGSIGVTGTPAFVIGDRMLSGAVGYDALKQAVDAARKGQG